MRVFQVKATKGENGKKCLTIKGFVTGIDLNAIKKKLAKMGYPTEDKLPIRKWVEVALFDWDYE